MGEVTRIAAGEAYDVLVGHGLRAEILAAATDARRVAVIYPAALQHLAEGLLADLDAGGHRTLALAVPDAEAAKDVRVAADCWAALGQAGFTRSDLVVAVGGGATTDLGGFVAATWLRGVRLVVVPTTLLGMVDAAIGGKTAINTAEGKNLVGAFHLPVRVVCDLDLLATLPERDLTAGLAEVVKVGFTSDPTILDLVHADPVAHRRELVERAIRVKSAVTTDDPRESRPGGLGREVLNYGHTFAHAIEQVEAYGWRHGDAVSVGLVYVAELARLAGRLPAADADRHRQVLAGLGLPTTYRAGRWTALLEAMKVDKKTRGDQLRFVVLDGIGRPALLEGPQPDLLEAAYSEVCS